jgi:hypothetical protein
MSAPRRTSRRRFLLGVVAVGVPVAVAPLRPWRALVRVSTPPLADLLEHRESAIAVGREYMAVSKTERTTEALLAELTAALPGGADAAKHASQAELRGMLAARIRRDFEDDVTVSLRGWIVSRTEGRLCALAARRRPTAPA